MAAKDIVRRICIGCIQVRAWMKKHQSKVRSKLSWKIVHSHLLYRCILVTMGLLLWTLSLCCFLAVLTQVSHVKGHDESLRVEGSQFLSPPNQPTEVADFGSAHSRGLPKQRFIHNLETIATMRGSPRGVAPRENKEGETTELCKGKYIYIHAIPREFNVQLLEQCHTLSEWTDMCRYLSNGGFGPPLLQAAELSASLSNSWFQTHQFSLEVLFHTRMQQYPCLTSNSRTAVAIYVPFYAGLEASRCLWNHNHTIRDAGPLRFADWVKRQPEWEAFGGCDHFMVAGRITWDFRRVKDEAGEWGNKLLHLPEMRKMTTLLVEGSPWDNNDVAIPYPTYFHPSSDSEISIWQTQVMKFKRKVMFSFAGGGRPHIKESIREHIMQQCRQSKHCKLLACNNLGVGKCNSPEKVMELFEESVFCLQPPGDSATRRSIFDSILAGCIPVFFHPNSFSGYKWHFPQNQSSYSVYIPESHVRSRELNIESQLLQISSGEIKKLQKAVIQLIPGLVYAHPRKMHLQKFHDAFDIAVQVLT